MPDVLAATCPLGHVLRPLTSAANSWHFCPVCDVVSEDADD